jgi:hypothetical protein
MSIPIFYETKCIYGVLDPAKIGETAKRLNLDFAGHALIVRSPLTMEDGTFHLA